MCTNMFCYKCMGDSIGSCTSLFCKDSLNCIFPSTIGTLVVSFSTKVLVLHLKSLCMLINMFIHVYNYHKLATFSSCFTSIFSDYVIKRSTLLAKSCIYPVLVSYIKCNLKISHSAIGLDFEVGPTKVTSIVMLHNLECCYEFK